MIVYLDVLIFINIFEDFLLLLAVKRILRLNARYHRLLLGAVSGGALSVISLWNVGFFIGLFVKILCACVLTLISFGYKSRTLFIKTSGTLFTVTFLLSGAMICFWLALKPNGMAVINDVVYFDIAPIPLIILTLIVYFILILYRKLFKNHAGSGLVHNIIILHENNNVEVKCKSDSGLTAKEPFSGDSVIVIERSRLGFEPNGQKLRAVPFQSLGGNGIIPAFRPEKVTIDGKELASEVYIGLSDGLFKTEISGIIPETILGEVI